MPPPRTMMLFRAVAILLFRVQACLANVEKTIFLGPESVNVPLQHPTLEDLRIDILTPEHPSLRTQLEAQFPSSESKSGKEAWLLLDRLVESQRYEVRICWPASQPTSFALDTYELAAVWDSPDLISSLAEFSQAQQLKAVSDTERRPTPGTQGEREASVLLLRVAAAADYYTANTTLMSQVPPVDVDIILDPFVLDVLPRSLLPTVGLLIAAAFASFFVARWVVSWIERITESSSAAEDKKLQ